MMNGNKNQLWKAQGVPETEPQHETTNVDGMSHTDTKFAPSASVG